jgi:hypothetical protein
MPDSMLNLAALKETPLQRDPFEHVVVPDFVPAEALQRVMEDFPAVSSAGSYPLQALQGGAAFTALAETLQGDEMTAAISEKFDISLDGRPTMITVRGQCRPSDGQIHTDSNGKLVTVLLYLNESWDTGGGRLRLLRSPDDLDDFAVEVPPAGGTMLAFRCTENAWHGHKSFEGMRRSIQLNWVRDAGYLRKERFRHGVSALFKKARFA